MDTHNKNSLTLLYTLFLDPFHTQKTRLFTLLRNSLRNYLKDIKRYLLSTHEHVYLYYYLVAYVAT